MDSDTSHETSGNTSSGRDGYASSASYLSTRTSTQTTWLAWISIFVSFDISIGNLVMQAVLNSIAVIAVKIHMNAIVFEDSLIRNLSRIMKLDRQSRLTDKRSQREPKTPINQSRRSDNQGTFAG